MNTKIFLFVICIFCYSAVNAQVVKRVKKRIGKYEKVEYYVLKSDRSIQHGPYHHYKLFYKKGYKYTITKGTYSMGHKVGLWNLDNNSLKSRVEFYNDQGKMQWSEKRQKGTTIKHIYNDDGDIIKTILNNKSITKISEDTSFVEYEISKYNLQGNLINNTKDGTWKYGYADTIGGCLNYKGGILDGLCFALDNNKDTIAKKFYSDTTLQWLVVFRNGDTLYHTKRISDSLTLFYHYFSNTQLHQFAEIGNDSLKTLKTFDAEGNALPKGTVTNGKGTFATYTINSDSNTLELDESCPIQSGKYNGTYTYHQDTGDNISEFKMGYRMTKADTLSHKFIGVSWQDFILADDSDIEGGYHGGENKLQKQVAEEFKMPNIAMDLEISGLIYMQFIVEIDGELSEIHSIAPKERRLGYGLEKESARVIGASQGNSYPAFRFGFPVRSYWRFPFEIDNSSF